MTGAQSTARARAITEFSIEIHRTAEGMAGTISAPGPGGNAERHAGAASILEMALARAIVDACDNGQDGLLDRLTEAFGLVGRHLPDLLGMLAAERLLSDAPKKDAGK